MELEFDAKLSAQGLVQVFIDDRELRSKTAKRLFELGAVLQTKRLEVGDFILSTRAAVERKNAPDFESSIIDGRLFAQVKELKENFASPLIALVGTDFERINPKALRGAFISLAIDYKMPLLFFESEEELGDFIYAIGEREQLLEKREMKVNFAKKGTELWERQRVIVESLPGVGPRNAVALLEHFKSVKSVVNASASELQQVEGIGESKAMEMKKVLEEKWMEKSLP